MNAELKKIVSRVKSAQVRLQDMLKKQDWMEEARRYAEKQGKEVKSLFSSDLEKVKVFIERERKELERFQKQIPGEVKKFKTLLAQQGKELEKVLGSIGALNGHMNKKKRKSGSKKSGAAGSKNRSTRSGTRKKAAPSA